MATISILCLWIDGQTVALQIGAVVKLHWSMPDVPQSNLAHTQRADLKSGREIDAENILKYLANNVIQWQFLRGGEGCSTKNKAARALDPGNRDNHFGPLLNRGIRKGLFVKWTQVTTHYVGYHPKRQKYFQPSGSRRSVIRSRVMQSSRTKPTVTYSIVCVSEVSGVRTQCNSFRLSNRMVNWQWFDIKHIETRPSNPFFLQ